MLLTNPPHLAGTGISAINTLPPPRPQNNACRERTIVPSLRIPRLLLPLDTSCVYY